MQFHATSDTFSLTEATVEDFSLPRITAATVRVVEANNQPVAGVSISLFNVRREFSGATEEGLSVEYYEADTGQSCTTPAAGTCEFVMFEGNQFSQLQFSFDRPHELGIELNGGEGEDTGEPTEIVEHLPFAASELDRLSGVVRDGAGDAALQEGEVSAYNVETHQSASAPIEAGGSYYFELPAGQYRVSVSGGGSIEGHQGLQFHATSDTFSLTEATVEDFSLPRITTATVRVVEANNQPVAGVSISLFNVRREFSGATEEGLGVEYYEADTGQSCTTPAAGTCEFVMFEGNQFSQLQFSFDRPHELGIELNGGEGRHR